MKKDMTPGQAVEHWEETVARIEEQLRSYDTTIQAKHREKAARALPAHTGDSAARKELRKINEDLARYQLERADLEEALTQACEKLDAAKADRDAELEQERMKKVSDLCEARLNLADEVERKMSELAEALIEYDRNAAEIKAGSGLHFANDQLMKLNSSNARLAMAARDRLGRFLDIDAPADPQRRGWTLRQLEEGALSNFILSDRGLRRLKLVS